jgi:hypothetical protein
MVDGSPFDGPAPLFCCGFGELGGLSSSASSFHGDNLCGSGTYSNSALVGLGIEGTSSIAPWPVDTCELDVSRAGCSSLGWAAIVRGGSFFSSFGGGGGGGAYGSGVGVVGTNGSGVGVAGDSEGLRFRKKLEKTLLLTLVGILDRGVAGVGDMAGDRDVLSEIDLTVGESSVPGLLGSALLIDVLGERIVLERAAMRSVRARCTVSVVSWSKLLTVKVTCCAFIATDDSERCEVACGKLALNRLPTRRDCTTTRAVTRL